MIRLPAVSGPYAAAAGYIPFLECLSGYLEGHRAQDESVSRGLIIVHLCNLGRINTSAGYRVAHQLRRRLANALTDMLRGDDWMMPLTEDRLGVILHSVMNTGHLLLAANRIGRIAADLPRLEPASPALEIRIGAALFPEHGESAEQLLCNGELAVELAALRRTPIAVFEPAASRLVTDHWGLEAEIDRGMENGEFSMAYQPKVDALTRKPQGAEALMRWDNPRLGPIPPSEFIPVAEASGRIDALTDFALHNAARDAMAWPSPDSRLTVAINLSPTVIERGDAVANFEHVAAIWGIGMERLTAEVTEDGIVSRAGAALGVLRELRDAGVRVSIDDFGTGNSSLAYFKDIPADELKIDKSFIAAMFETEANRRLVKTIIDLAHGFDLEVVAEGVETAYSADYLQELGCDVLQGYYFSRPLPQDEFVAFLASTR
jgi:EAL domain-containing protein (putative c-di-GMP-specific phosphodiesterase class I)/GGDEF domain-containing protein